MQSVQSEVILSVNIISFLIGFPANILALYAFSVKIHSKPLLTDILLLNLTISDLLLLIILPLKMHEAASDMSWTLSDVMCSINLLYLLFHHLHKLSAAVGGQRGALHRGCIPHHLSPAAQTCLCRSYLCCYLADVHSTLQQSQSSHSNHPALSSGNISMCYEDFSQKQLEVLLPVRLEFFIVLCLLPLVISVYCYVSCILILYSRPRISKAQKKKSIGMALGTLAVFLICVLPYNISHVWGYVHGKSPEWRYYTLLLSTFNTCIDPIIFFFSSSTFRCSSKNFVLKKVGAKFLEMQKPDTNTG
uniref:Si:ch211-231m23.4 n=1 Tax=Gouania willdenowi TaxID=441366 RepID=A0A8C5GXY7_GOUWI